MHEGGIGKVYMARGLCFKRAPGIGKYPDGPMAPGEQYKLNVESTTYEPTYDAAYLSKVDYDLWLGPAPKRPFNRNRFHYNWHWHWDYGNGDTGNQGPHQFDIARWGLGKQEHPVRVISTRRLLRSARRRRRRPTSTRRSSSTPTARCSSSRRAARTPTTKGPSEDRQPVLRRRRAGSGSTATARKWQSYLGPKDEKGRAPTCRTPDRPAAIRTCSRSIEYPHYQNFVDAMRAGDPKISRATFSKDTCRRRCRTWRTSPTGSKRSLNFDGKTEHVSTTRLPTHF